MARSGGGRMFPGGSYSRLSRNSFYNELDLECARALNSPSSWSNPTDTGSADRDPWRTLPGSVGPSKTITRCLAIALPRRDTPSSIDKHNKLIYKQRCWP
jgi:hypothetical protein